jgi:spore germination cell wall hydrolase CwlJ-like protein
MVFEPILLTFETIALSKTTMQNIMTNSLVRSTATVIKCLGLAGVIWALTWVVQAKFDNLKEARSQLPLSVTSVEDRMRQLDCLTRNIYWEAASEPFEGKVAVAQVTLNRVESGKFPNTVCGVVYQKNVVYERVVCQFSWFCEGTHKVRAIHAPLYKESEEVAKRVLFEGFRLPSLKNAMYYHADYVNPGWKLPRIEKIGRHIFYGERV